MKFIFNHTYSASYTNSSLFVIYCYFMPVCICRFLRIIIIEIVRVMKFPIEYVKRDIKMRTDEKLNFLNQQRDVSFIVDSRRRADWKQMFCNNIYCWRFALLFRSMAKIIELFDNSLKDYASSLKLHSNKKMETCFNLFL